MKTSWIGVGLVVSLFGFGCASTTDDEAADQSSSSEEALCMPKPVEYIGYVFGYRTYYNGCGYYQKTCKDGAVYIRSLCGSSSTGFYVCGGMTGQWRSTGQSCR